MHIDNPQKQCVSPFQKAGVHACHQTLCRFRRGHQHVVTKCFGHDLLLTLIAC